MTRRLLLAPLAALLLAAAPAQAATRTLTASRAVDRDCTARVLPSKSRGVTSTTFRAPAEGTVRARLLGKPRDGDWDLVAFDSAGKKITGSAAFEANELVEVNLRRDARITLQACRVSGRGRSVPLRTDFAKVDFEALEQPGTESLVEVPIAGPATINALEALGLDVTHDIHDGHARVMLYGDRDRKILQQTGLGFEVIHPDVPAAERAWLKLDRQRAKRNGASALPTGRTEYRTYDDVQKELKDMVAQYPTLVRPFTLKTKTFQGRDIEAVEVATDVASDDDTRPVLFLNGIHHAREWPATEVIVEFVWDLLKNNKTDPQLAEILKNVRVVMQPYTNLDGFLISRAALGQPDDPDSDEGFIYSTATGVVILGGSFGYKRKNCNPYPVVAVPGAPCEVAIGTDNNRNYAHQWGGAGGSTNPNDQSYRGPGPSSEPETKAVQELHLSLNAPVLISMHNIAAKVLRPPGTEAEGFAPDEPALKELGRRMADPTGYLNQYGWELYDVTGGTKDWAYAATSAFGYTIETGPANGDFHGSYQSVVIDQYEGAGERKGRGMREALIQAANWTREEQHTSRVQGRAPAGRTLRITKEIKTLSSAVCTVASPAPVDLGNGGADSCVAPGAVMEYPEKVDFSTRVPANGNFTWWMNPSTRPYSKSVESYHLTCADGDKVLQELDVAVKRGETLKVDLPCGGALPPLVVGTGTGTGTGGSGGTGGTGNTGGTGATLPATGVLEVISAAVDKGKRATARKRGLRARVRCSIQCKATATATISKKVARQLGLGKRKLKIGVGRASITKAGRIPFYIKFTAKTKKALAKKKVKKFKLAVVIVVTDNAGKQAKRFSKTSTLR